MARQRAVCEAYAAREGVEIAGEEYDVAVSGADRDVLFPGHFDRRARALEHRRDQRLVELLLRPLHAEELDEGLPLDAAHIPPSVDDALRHLLGTFKEGLGDIERFPVTGPGPQAQPHRPLARLANFA